MKFINSDDEEDLDMLAQRNTQMRKAVGILKELSADERTHLILDDREKARRDISSMVGGARAEGRTEGHAEGLVDGIVSVARNMLSKNMPVELIVTATGLSHERITELADTLKIQ